MKQSISKTQFNELSQDAKERLYKSLFPDQMKDENRTIGGFRVVIDINPAYITIGRMIEFLGEDYKYTTIDTFGDQEYATTEVVPTENICDALWESVKENLETDPL